MKPSKSTLLLLAGLALIAVSFGCSSGGAGFSLFGGAVAFPTTPKFLIAVDANGSGANVNVFPINATTGALGSAVTGSPFDMGLTNGITVAVHPNGHFVYVADASDGSIHAWDVNETTGVPTQIAAKVINESGLFFTTSNSGSSTIAGTPMHVITITPNGNFLYATNHDAMVSAYSIGSNGALTHIGDLNVAACSTGAITATNDFAWVTDTCPANSNGGPWHVMAMKIGSNGALTKVSTATLTSVFSFLWSIAVNPAGTIVQVGDEGGDAQVYSFTVGADGSLTQVGPQVIETSSSDCRDIAFSPDGKFFYTSDDDDEVHAITQNANGSITELGASPYVLAAGQGDGQIVADVTGQFVYVGGGAFNLTVGEVTGFTRNMTTGALTKIGVTPTAKHDPMGIGIVR